MEKIKMEKPLLAPDYVWEAYSIINIKKTEKPCHAQKMI
jgi:hypothetical protein